ncbi:MAG: hypothetical protein HQK77_20410 [Desulfobacterales bacterium]|nr:hypothetical protein [Desulfobacterales bacterium]
MATSQDLIELQKYSWRYLEVLQERDLLLADAIITVKNNLMSLAIEQKETRDQITRMADRIYHRFVELEDRVTNLEVEMTLHSWLLTLATYDYEEKFPPHFRLLKIIRDFFVIKPDQWNLVELKYLQKAVKEVGLDWKQTITINRFVNELIDEIEHLSFSAY